jgi:hypothetical protein
MPSRWIILGLILIAFTTACSGEEPATATSKPVPTIAGLPLEAASVPAHLLIRNPEALEGQFIRISGNYKQLPLLVCADETHRSPASWLLQTEGLEIPVAGFDSALRELGVEGMPMEVDGRWQSWEGPVGCGRRVPVQQIWYLAVTEILSPNPLTAGEAPIGETAGVPVTTIEITAAPPAVTLITEPTSPLATGLPGPTERPTVELETTPTSAATPSPSSAAISPSATVATELTSTSAATLEGSATITTTATATTTSGLTPSPAASGTVTVTSEATETATATDTAETSEDIINYEDIITGMIAGGTVLRWDFIGSAGDLATISVAPDFDLDVSLELVAPDGSIIESRDEAAAGQPETISQVTVSDFGTYGIRILSRNNSSGSFALVLSDSESEAYMIYRATLDYGFSDTENLPAETDFLYAFYGVSGESITAAVESVSVSNMVLYLFSPNGGELEFIDDDESTASGSREELTNYSLSDTGFYTIRIGEWDFEAATFLYSLARGQ